MIQGIWALNRLTRLAKNQLSVSHQDFIGADMVPTLSRIPLDNYGIRMTKGIRRLKSVFFTLGVTPPSEQNG